MGAGHCPWETCTNAKNKNNFALNSTFRNAESATLKMHYSIKKKKPW